MLRRCRALVRDRSGVAAIEFALLAPAFIMLLVGTMSMSAMLFANNSLHFATQAAARCASVKTTICKDAASTVTYAKANYFGGSDVPVFTCTGRSCGGSKAACGNKVTGRVEIIIDIGIATYATPLAADACYP